jgi:hypothetical protein
MDWYKSRKVNNSEQLDPHEFDINHYIVSMPTTYPMTMA